MALSFNSYNAVTYFFGYPIMAIASITHIGSRFLGSLLGGILGSVTGPFIGAWYTYKTTKPRGFDVGFALSLISFFPRLLFNGLSFLFLGLASGLFQGAKNGHKEGFLWPYRMITIINHPRPGLGLLQRLFSVQVLDPIPSIGPAILSPILQAQNDEKKEVFSESAQAFLAGKPYLALREEKEEKEGEEEKCEVLDTFLNLNRVNFNHYKEKEFKALTLKLKTNKYGTVTLNHNGLQSLKPEGITSLMECIKEGGVAVLFMNFTDIGHWSLEQLTAFCKSLENNKTLDTLYLNSTQLDNFSPQHFKMLMSAIAQTNMTSLDLGNNNLSKFKPKALFTHLSPLLQGKVKVSALFLDQNNLGQWPKGALAEFMVQMKMTQFDLSKNQLQHQKTKTWETKDIQKFMSRICSMHGISIDRLNLADNNFTEAQRKLFETGTDGGIKEKRQLVYGHFFHRPLGQSFAKVVAHTVCSFVGIELIF